jgi:crotonobetainyl-CoA:carnitine CoA-transferase CaiB-like acyl-CoA transferase
MPSQRLLEGVRVVDLSQYIPGPFATRQLADLGAEVIKIEPPGGDPMRRFMQQGNNAPSPVYRHINRGKRVCELDLKSTPGCGELENLLASADILLESFRPGVLARLGFTRERIDAINPRLIHCALSGYGQTGPYAQRAGHDINYCAASSQSIVSGSAERPLIGYPPIADHAAALQAAVAMLAALHARDRHPRGIYLDISMTESILSWQYLPILTGADQRAANILNGGAACYNLYRSADGAFFSLGALETAFWRNFCDALNQPQWIERQYESMPQRQLIDEVAALIATRPLAYWQDLLNPIDCCFEVLFTPAQLARQAQFEARAALNADGPTYPARIDQQAVVTASEFEQIDDIRDLGWSGTIS